MPSMTRIYVPADSAALALDADALSAAIVAEAGRLGTPVEIVRNGSHGMHWLEPLVEVQTATDRVGYGPVTVADVPGLFAAGWIEGGSHALRIGDPLQHPFMVRQTRWTFVRCGIIDPERGPFRFAQAPLAQKTVEVTHPVTITAEAFRFARIFTGLEVIKEAGTLIGWDGEREVRTPYDDCVLVMPSKRLYRGQTAVRMGHFVAMH